MEEYIEFIKNDLEDSGEYPVANLLPFYNKFKKGKTLKIPVYDYEENYEISDNEFDIIKQQIKILIKELNLGLFEYIGAINVSNWEDNFNKIEDSKLNILIEDMFFWKGSNNKNYFLAEK